MSGTAAAFFDLDRTLMAGSSAYHFGRAMYKAGGVSRRQIARDALDQLRFRLRGSTDAGVNALLERVMAAIKDKRVSDLARMRPDMLAGILPRVYPQMIRVVRDHQDAGRPAYIVTAASHEMAEVLAIVLAMDGAVGTRSEVADGVYTGRVNGPFVYGAGKRRPCASSPKRAPSTWTAHGPTRTPPPTCRCWRRSAIPSPSTPI